MKNLKNRPFISCQGIVQMGPNLSRYSCVHDQTFVRSCSDFRAFMFGLSCVHVRTFVRSCSDFRAFMFRLLCVYQTFVRSCSDFRAFMFRFSCVHIQTFVRLPDFCAFMFRLSCVHVQTFVRFLIFPDYVTLNARRPPRAFIISLDILASVWDLYLGTVLNVCEQKCDSKPN